MPEIHFVSRHGDVAKIWWLLHNNGHANAARHAMEKGRKRALISHFLQHLLWHAGTRRNRSIRRKLILHTNQFLQAAAQMRALTAARQINQVRNGPRCRHDKKSGGGAEAPYGLMERAVTGCISERRCRRRRCRLFKMRGIQASLGGPKWFLELFAFKSEYQWCVGIRLAALETNMFEIEMPNKTLVRSEAEIKFLPCQRTAPLLLPESSEAPGVLAADTQNSGLCV